MKNEGIIRPTGIFFETFWANSSGGFEGLETFLERFFSPLSLFIFSFLFPFIFSLLFSSFLFHLLSLFSRSSLLFLSCLSCSVSLSLSSFSVFFLCLLSLSSSSVFFFCFLSLSLSVTLCDVLVVVVVSGVYVVVVAVRACVRCGVARVCTGTTPACGNTCGRGAGTHGDVLNVHTGGDLNVQVCVCGKEEREERRRGSACHTNTNTLHTDNTHNKEHSRRHRQFCIPKSAHVRLSLDPSGSTKKPLDLTHFSV